MSELYRSPTGQVEDIASKKCGECAKLRAGSVSSNPLVGQRYTCTLTGVHVTLSTFACQFFPRVNGWTKLELVTLSPLAATPNPAP